MGLSVPQKNFDGLFVPDPYISSWVNHYSMFFSCLTQKKIYFLRMGGWPSLKTERRRQKWTSDMDLEQIIHQNSFVAQTTTQPKAVDDTGLHIRCPFLSPTFRFYASPTAHPEKIYLFLCETTKKH